MDGERRIVSVSSDSIEAYAEPQFVLEFDGKIYVTLALVEYDPNDAEMAEDERSDLSELQSMLEGDRIVSGTIVDAPREAMAGAQSESRDIT